MIKSDIKPDEKSGISECVNIYDLRSNKSYFLIKHIANIFIKAGWAKKITIKKAKKNAKHESKSI